MSSDIHAADINPAILGDVQFIADCVAAGKPIPPGVIRRVEQDADSITERLRHRYGMLDIGGPAIRGLRGALPDA